MSTTDAGLVHDGGMPLRVRNANRQAAVAAGWAGWVMGSLEWAIFRPRSHGRTPPASTCRAATTSIRSCIRTVTVGFAFARNLLTRNPDRIAGARRLMQGALRFAAGGELHSALRTSADDYADGLILVFASRATSTYETGDCRIQRAAPTRNALHA